MNSYLDSQRVFLHQRGRIWRSLLVFVLAAAMLTGSSAGTVLADHYGGEMVVTEVRYDPGELHRAFLPFQVEDNYWNGEAVEPMMTDLSYMNVLIDENDYIYADAANLCIQLNLNFSYEVEGIRITSKDSCAHKSLYFPYTGGFTYETFKGSVTMNDVPGIIILDNVEYLPMELIMVAMDCEYLPLRDSEEEILRLKMIPSRLSAFDVLEEVLLNQDIYDFDYNDDFGLTDGELEDTMYWADVVKTTSDLINLDFQAVDEAFDLVAQAFSDHVLPINYVSTTTFNDREGMQDFLTMMMQPDELELRFLEMMTSPIVGHIMDIVTNTADVIVTGGRLEAEAIVDITIPGYSVYLLQDGKWVEQLQTYSVYTLENHHWKKVLKPVQETAEKFAKADKILKGVQAGLVAASVLIKIAQSIAAFSDRDETACTSIGNFLDYVKTQQTNSEQSMKNSSGTVPAMDKELQNTLLRQYDALKKNTTAWAVGEALMDNIVSIAADVAGIFFLIPSLILAGIQLEATLINYFTDGSIDASKSLTASYFGLLYEDDARNYFLSEYRKIPAGFTDEDIKNTAYALYNYLKSAYLTRKLALEGCKFMNGYEKAKASGDKINENIMKMTAALSMGLQENGDLGATSDEVMNLMQNYDNELIYETCIPLPEMYFNYLKDSVVPADGTADAVVSGISQDNFNSSMNKLTGLLSAVVYDIDDDTWPELLTVSGSSSGYPYRFALNVYVVDHTWPDVELAGSTRTGAYVECSDNTGTMSAHIQSSEGTVYIITDCDFDNNNAMTWSYWHKNVYQLAEDRTLIDVTRDTEELGGASGVSLHTADNMDTILCVVNVNRSGAESIEYTNTRKWLQDPEKADYYDVCVLDLDTYYEELSVSSAPQDMLLAELQAVAGACTNTQTTDDGVHMTSFYQTDNNLTFNIVTNMSTNAISSVTIGDGALFNYDQFVSAMDSFLAGEATEEMMKLYRVVINSQALNLSDADRAALANVILQADTFTDQDQIVYNGERLEHLAESILTYQRQVILAGAERCTSTVTIEIAEAGTEQ